MISMLIGVGFNLKDKRVDKMLRSKGIMDADIFYSPIKCWLVLLLLLGLQMGIIVIMILNTVYSLLLIPYFIISYFVNAYYNNSFALHEDKITIINPNFPFRQITTIDIQDIQCIVIDRDKRKWTPWFILIFRQNYLLIKTNNKKMKFYCSGLEIDCYDENWTEKTIDDLETELRQKGISTDFKLTY
jgi:hypothetical protein